MADVRQLTMDVLQQHASDGCDYCACGHRYSWDEGAPGWNTEWSEHVTDYLLATLRNAGIGLT